MPVLTQTPSMSGLVLDPIAAATAQAMALVQVTTRSGFAERAYKPLAKPSVGLGAPLNAVIQRQIPA